ncbi:hypothetical protein PM082_020284 [Marasmius tenuissimus]|nr:hypothetical protein PM082_020284 [Marasmius tenuissimus]
MGVSIVFLTASVQGVLGYKFERLDKNNTVLVVGHQIKLFELVKDYEPVEFRNNVLAHAALGDVFNLPTVITTTTDSRRSKCLGQFRAAVKAIGKTQVIRASIVTDEGYTVFHNSEASGTYNKRIAEEANIRMRDAGVQNLSMFAIATDLMRDWRSTPGLPELLPFFDKYFPVYGVLARNLNFASNGSQL